jgi:predicted transcriptional regulator
MGTVHSQLREAITSSKLSIKELAYMSSVARYLVEDFVEGSGYLRSYDFSKLCETLKLELVRRV